MRNGTKTVSRPRGRPRSFDEAEVLDRVRAVFLEKGFSAASLDDLAAAAGLNRPSLYAAFGDKEQLYIAALKRYGVTNVEAVNAIMGRDGPIARRLEQCFRAAINMYCAGPRQLGCMIISTATVEAAQHPKIAEVAARLMEDFEQAFESAFARAVADGEIGAKPSPATRARLASAVLDTLAVRARMGASAASLKAYVTTIVPAICG
jgi:TetR/AcrR family transcriptional regulator, copper-responsive repressor